MSQSQALIQQQFQTQVDDEIVREIAIREVTKLNEKMENDRITELMIMAGITAAKKLQREKAKFQKMGKEAADNLMAKRIDEKINQRLQSAAKNKATKINQKLKLDAAMEKVRAQIKFREGQEEILERVRSAQEARDLMLVRNPPTVRTRRKEAEGAPEHKRIQPEGAIVQIAVDNDEAQEKISNEKSSKR